MAERDARRAAGDAELVAFGRPFLANPDLPAGLRNGWPLNRYDRATFHHRGARAHADHPLHEELVVAGQ